MLTHLLIAVCSTALSPCFVPTTLTVDDILNNVENADVSSVTATVAYTKTDPILNRREIRTGKVLFRMDEDSKREAAILFDTLIIGRRKETSTKHYIFSGRWMAEIDHGKKQFIKRELVAPGQEGIDPFELGSGPIPLPIGQTRESILAKFNVVKTDIPEHGSLSKLNDNVIGLRLTPKTKDEWESIDLFYDPATWLPVGVQTIETDGTIRISRLTNVSLNALTAEEAQLLNMELPNPKEWSIDVRPYLK
jgi:hypothetical protein